MTTSPTAGLIDLLRTAALRDGAGIGDGELLGRFVEMRDPAALAALVRRHGPMVWGVCRRLLGHHDAEDAFQATFVALAQKADSVAPREMLANWLHGVARRTALQARRAAARRRAREAQAARSPDSEAAPPDEWADARPVLDEELCRLPDDYRAAIVLCDLEGRTRKDAARHLGCPEGTLAGRLVRARAMLAKRLARRGVAPLAVALAAPTLSLTCSTVKAATLVAASQSTAVISAEAAALTQGVLKTMSLHKLTAAIAVSILTLAVAGAGFAFHVSSQGDEPAASDNPPAVEARVKVPQKKEKQEEANLTAWGKEVGGLQAGLGLKAGKKRVYRHGETITLAVRVRNVSKKDVTFEYLRQYQDENPPTVTDKDGKPIAQSSLDVLGMHVPVKVTLAPGQQIELESRMTGKAGQQYALRPAGGFDKRDLPGSPLIVAEGKCGLQLNRVFGDTGSGRITIDPVLSKLATGKLELEIEADGSE